MSTYPIALNLIQTRINGNRKGSDIPNWTHSQNVFEILKRYEFADDVCLAGLLHDVIEDSDVTFDELRSLGFSDRVIELVDLCSHDMIMKDGDARWVKMVAQLIDTNDADAFAIKLADILDNVRGSITMDPDRAWFLKNVKARLLFEVTRGVEGVEGLRGELKQEIG